MRQYTLPNSYNYTLPSRATGPTAAETKWRRVNASCEIRECCHHHNLVSERFESSVVLKTRDEDYRFWKHRTLDCWNGTQEIEKATCAVNGEDFDVRDWNE